MGLQGRRRHLSVTAAVAALFLIVGVLVPSGVAAASPGAPGAPSSVSALGLEAAATVSWQPPSASGSSPVSGYVITVSPPGAAGSTMSVAGSSLTATVGGLSDGTSYTFAVAAVNGSGPGPTTAAPGPVVPAHPGGQYHPLSPYRICDTRAGNPSDLSGTDAQCAGETLAGGQALTMQVTGTAPSGSASGGVPVSGVTAAVLNVTVADTIGGGYLTLWPAGQPRPLASNLNWVAGETVPNLVEVPVNSSGQVSVYLDGGSADVIADVEGYVAPDASSAVGLYYPLSPYRICDTRNANPSGVAGLDAQCQGKTLAPGATLTIQATGTNPSGLTSGGVPAAGVSAVVLNVTVTDTTAAGYLTVWPAGQARPIASNLNWTAAKTVPNRVVVPVSSSGQVSFYNLSGSTDVIVDVGGYYDAGSGSSPGSYLSGASPTRICDTRTGNPSALSGPAAQCNSQPLGTGAVLTINVAGVGPVPALSSGSTPPVAAVLNVTVTGTTAGGYLTAWPAGGARPVVSDLNWKAGQTVPNLVVVQLGSAGQVSFFNAAGGTINVVVDVVGYFSGADVVPPSTVPLSAQSLSLLDSIGPEQSVLNFSGTDSQLGAVIPGDIVTAGPTPLAPEGLLLAVTSVSTLAGGGMSVATSQASLTQVAPQGAFQVAGAPVDALNPPTAPTATATRALSASSTSGSTGNTLKAFVQAGPCSGSGSGSFNYSAGFTTFTVTPNFNASWQWGLPPSVSIGASLRVDETYQASLTVSASASISCQVPIDGLNNLMLSQPIPVPIGPVDFTLTPVLQAKLQVATTGSLSQPTTFTATQSAYAQAGIEYQNGGFTPNGGTGCDPPVPDGTPLCTTMHTTSSSSVKLTVSAGPLLSLVGAIDAIPILSVLHGSSELWYVGGPVVGPSISFGLAGQLTLQPQAPIWSIGINFTIGVGFTANWTIGPITLGFNYTYLLVNQTAQLAHAVEIDSTGELPNAQVGEPYTSAPLSASGGATPYSWAMGTGSPPWLSINATTGVLGGTPPASVANTTVNVPVQVTDSFVVNTTATQTLQLPVGVPPLIITTSSLPDPTAGKPYIENLQAIGGVAPYTWAVQPGSSLPAWLTLSPGGTLSGTPPPDAVATNPSIPIQVSDSNTNPGPDTTPLSISVHIDIPAITWSASPTSPEPLNYLNLFDVSCPTTTLCVAAAGGGDNSIYSQGPIQDYVVVYANGTWSQPILVDPDPGRRLLTSISCPTTAFCAAVDDAGNAFTYTNGTWSSPTDIDGTAPLAGVSCPNAAFCVAVDDAGNAFTYGNGTWSSPTVADPQGLSSVSCPTSGFCTAVGGAGSAVTYTNGTWSSPTDIDGTAYLRSVSCPTSGFCAAVDSTGTSVIYNSGTWAAPTDIDGTHELTSVSCPTSAFCTAVDTYGEMVTYGGGAWSVVSKVPNAPLINGYPSGVSCASAGFCAVTWGSSFASVDTAGIWTMTPVGPYGQFMSASCATGSTSCVVVDEAGFAYTDDNGVWSPPVLADPYGDLSGVSCAATTFCVAVDYSGNAITDSNGSWGPPTNIDGSQELLGISCPTSSFCAAVDWNGDALVDNNGSWSAPANIDGTNELTSVSCSTSAFCAAVDNAGNAFIYSNGVWSATHLGTFGLSYVSCPSATFCVAVAQQGKVSYYQSGSWSAPVSIAAGSLTAIACPSTTSCVATDASGDSLTYYHGAWSGPVNFAGIENPSAVSCPTDNSCVSVDGIVDAWSGAL